MFYFGYLFWEYPATLLIQKLPVAKFLAFDIFCWGIIVATTAACTSFGGLVAVRFLLGVAEAAISPGFLYVTAMWYTREEMSSRTGIWFAGNSLGGFVASVVGYGIGQIEDGAVAAWRWLFIVSFSWAMKKGSDELADTNCCATGFRDYHIPLVLCNLLLPTRHNPHRELPHRRREADCGRTSRDQWDRESSF